MTFESKFTNFRDYYLIKKGPTNSAMGRPPLPTGFGQCPKVLPETCDLWDIDYNSDNWEPEFMAIFVTWQLRVTLDSIHNFCDVSIDHWCDYKSSFTLKVHPGWDWTQFGDSLMKTFVIICVIDLYQGQMGGTDGGNGDINSPTKPPEDNPPILGNGYCPRCPQMTNCTVALPPPPSHWCAGTCVATQNSPPVYIQSSACIVCFTIPPLASALFTAHAPPPPFPTFLWFRSRSITGGMGEARRDEGPVSFRLRPSKLTTNCFADTCSGCSMFNSQFICQILSTPLGHCKISVVRFCIWFERIHLWHC